MTDFDPTKPVRQRNGREARILATDCRTEHDGVALPIVAETFSGAGRWDVSLFGRDGSTLPSDRSLVNIPERVSWFVPALEPRSPFTSVPLSKEQAMRYSRVNAAVELIFEGDEFIEAKYHRD